MKLELQTKKLKTAITLSEKISGKHATLPVLACILIEAGKNSVSFKATNLDMGIDISVPAKVEEGGTVAVPAHIISQFVSQLPDQNTTIVLESNSGNLVITSSSAKGVIKSLPTEDFPSIPTVSSGESFALPGEVLVKGLRSVWYSASVSSVKPELSSVYIYRKEERLVFVATDSFRLAEKKINAPMSTKLEDVLIPLKNISDIIRILETVGGNIQVRASKNLISFETDGLYAVSRLTEGTFPDYRQIVPKDHISEAVALKQDVLNSLKISNIFADKFNQVRLIIDPKKKIFEIQTKNSDIGENIVRIDAALSGERVELSFNCKYLSDCFQSIDADSVSFHIAGSNRPMIIRPVSGDQSFMYIAMPMNR